MRVPLLNFEKGPGVPLLNFEGGPRVSTFKLWGGGGRGPEVPGPSVLVPLLHHALVIQGIKYFCACY